MPYQFTRKPLPVSFEQIDSEICALLGEHEHPVYYCCDWFDRIILTIWFGKYTLAEVRANLVGRPLAKRQDEILKIIDYLDANFDLQYVKPADGKDTISATDATGSCIKSVSPAVRPGPYGRGIDE